MDRAIIRNVGPTQILQEKKKKNASKAHRKQSQQQAIGVVNAFQRLSVEESKVSKGRRGTNREKLREIDVNSQWSNKKNSKDVEKSKIQTHRVDSNPFLIELTPDDNAISFQTAQEMLAMESALIFDHELDRCLTETALLVDTMLTDEAHKIQAEARLHATIEWLKTKSVEEQRLYLSRNPTLQISIDEINR